MNKRPSSTLSLPTLLVGALLASCGAEPQQVTPPRDRPPVGNEELPNMPADHPDVADLKVSSRGPRRMSVDQLERSIEQLGNVPAGSVVLPPDLALTLGRPDFVRVTEEALDPSPLFMKFMMDLGGIICKNLSEYEPQRPVQDRVFTRYGDPEQNLRHMMLVFTGIEGEPANEYVTRLYRVYEAGVTGGGTELRGYEAVCLALFTSPEFLLY